MFTIIIYILFYKMNSIIQFCENDSIILLKNFDLFRRKEEPEGEREMQLPNIL